MNQKVQCPLARLTFAVNGNHIPDRTTAFQMKCDGEDVRVMFADREIGPLVIGPVVESEAEVALLNGVLPTGTFVYATLESSWYVIMPDHMA